MTVRELIELLKGFDPEMSVCYSSCSEYCLLDASDIKVEDLCHARPDGWVANQRPDQPTTKYLALP